jgi:hypothetical protein
MLGRIWSSYDENVVLTLKLCMDGIGSSTVCQPQLLGPNAGRHFFQQRSHGLQRLWSVHAGLFQCSLCRSRYVIAYERTNAWTVCNVVIGSTNEFMGLP